MINNVVLVGRLTKNVELRKTNSGISTATFTIACDRSFTDKDGQRQADFIQCVAWRQSADFLFQYASKGTMIGIEGSIQTRNYEGKDGKVYVTEVLCDRVRIIASPKNAQKNNEAADNLEEKAKQFASDNNVNFEEVNYAQQPSTPIGMDDLSFY